MSEGWAAGVRSTFGQLSTRALRSLSMSAGEDGAAIFPGQRFCNASGPGTRLKQVRFLDVPGAGRGGGRRQDGSVEFFGFSRCLFSGRGRVGRRPGWVVSAEAMIRAIVWQFCRPRKERGAGGGPDLFFFAARKFGPYEIRAGPPTGFFRQVGLNGNRKKKKKAGKEALLRGPESSVGQRKRNGDRGLARWWFGRRRPGYGCGWPGFLRESMSFSVNRPRAKKPLI